MSGEPPGVLRLDGDREWRNSEGKLHRLDGPTVIREDGTEQWWIEGVLQNGPPPVPFNYDHWNLDPLAL